MANQKRDSTLVFPLRQTERKGSDTNEYLQGIEVGYNSCLANIEFIFYELSVEAQQEFCNLVNDHIPKPLIIK